MHQPFRYQSPSSRRAAVIAWGACEGESGAIPERAMSFAKLLTDMGYRVELVGEGGGDRHCPYTLHPLRVPALKWPLGNITRRINYNRVVSRFLLREAERASWDIVIEHDQMAGSYIKRLQANHRTTCVAVQHCSVWQASKLGAAPFNPVVMAWWRANCARCYRESDAVICLNESYAEELKTRVRACRRIFVSPDGFAERDIPEKIYPQIPKVVYVGRLSPEKNVPLLVQAMADLREHPWDLEIIGAGIDRQRIMREIKRHRVESRVQLRGHLSNSEVLDHLRSATLIVLPSRHEAQGRVLLEAMSCGVPIVATSVGGVPYLLGFGRYGLLVPKDQVVPLRSAILSLLSDGALRVKLAQLGLQRVKDFSLSAQLERDRLILAKILQRRAVND